MAEHEHSHSHDHDHDVHMHDRDHPEDPIEAERNHLQSVLSAFTYYRRHSLNRNHRRRRDYMSLSEQHKRLIPDLLTKIDQVDRCIEQNMELLREIVKCTGAFMGIDPVALVAEGYRKNASHDAPPVSALDMDKVRSTLKQFVRDWAEEGKEERDATYGPILEKLESLYKDVSIEDRGKIRVLVPGAGLGRLAYEIARRGFTCQGNEYSFFMLVPSNFVLNRMTKEKQYAIYPFIHSFSNIRSTEQQLKPIYIPDVVPSNIPPTADFSMAAGEFVEVYRGDDSSRGAWDVVVTCFFIDTAKNVIDYLETIHQILKEGGTWINIGPLLYHWEDMPGELSIELSLEELKRVCREIGFEFQEELTINTTYTTNTGGMLKYVYECEFWTATKAHNKP